MLLSPDWTVLTSALTKGYFYQSSETNRERVVKLYKRKIALKEMYVPYIGHVLTSEGVKADPAKVEAIFKMDRPTDVDGVQRIM